MHDDDEPQRARGPWIPSFCAAVLASLMIHAHGAAQDDQRSPEAAAEPPKAAKAAKQHVEPAVDEAAAVEAAQPASAQEGDDAKAQDSGQEVIGAMRTRAAQLNALVDGRLDPSVDGDALLRFDATDAGFSIADIDVAMAAAAARGKAAQLPAAPEGADELTLARLSLQQALVDYMRLPTARKRMLLKRHLSRRTAHDALKTEVQQLKEREAQLAKRAEHLAQLLADSLPIDVDPKGLVVVDLGPTPTATSKSSDDDSPLGTQRSELLGKIEAHRARIEELQQSFRALSGDEQKALFARHAKRRTEAVAGAQAAKLEEERKQMLERERAAAATRARSEAERAAEEAERAQQEALKAAAEARSEAERLLAAERARLLGMQGEIARADAELAERATRIEQRYDEALGFVNRVQALQARSILDRKKEADAAALYSELRGEARNFRHELVAALDELATPHSQVPPAQEGAKRQLLEGIEEEKLAALRSRLDTEREALLQREDQLRWRRAMKLRDALAVLNEARLDTLTMVPAATRARVTGFGPDAVAQAGSEAEHMVLMLRYHSQAFPAELRKLRDKIGSSTLAIVLTLLQIVVLVVVFRWWRQHADNIMAGFHKAAREAVAPNWITRALAILLWYGRRVRAPIEWAVLCALIFSFVEGIEGLESVGFIWAILEWGLTGWAAVLLLDAFAARQTIRPTDPDGNPELRLRSLRLVALLIVVNGLILSLTEQSVGRGTIHAWTADIAGLLVLPVLALLVFWWRPHIFERIDDRPDPPRLLVWAKQRSTGWTSFVAAAVGGGYMLLEGIVRWLARSMRGFEVAERLSAYVFRNQVEKHVLSKSGGKRRALPDSEVVSMLPGSEPPGFVEEIEKDNLEEVEALARTPGSIVVVVGERGLGKSTFLRRLQDRLPVESVRSVSCPREGFDALLTRLGSALGGPAPRGDAAVAAALRSANCATVLLDDVHLLTRPSVGGLADFDRLLDVARASAQSASWVLAVSSHAWSYIERARGTLGIDRVVVLTPWSRAQIGQLAQSRAREAGITPSFEELVVPRSFDLDDDPSESRLEGGFYRILWDYAGGNPGVALHCWRRSLFRRDDGKLVVTLFDGPTTAGMDDLPPLLPFVLRALAQLGEGDAETIARCANLPANETLDLLRLAVRRGYVEEHDGVAAISAHYYRAVTTLLRRQHLLT